MGKGHAQNEDTYLNKGGVNEVTASEIVKNILNTALLTFALAIETGINFFNLIDGITDDYGDESGIDVLASINEVYNAIGTYYTPPEPGYTTDLCVGGNAFADGYYSTYYPSYAFDNLDSTWPAWYVTSLRPHWIGYDFGVGNEKKITKLRFKPMNELGVMVKDFQFQGSNNYSDWTTVYTGVAAASETWQEFLFDNLILYRYYRIYITSSYRVDQEYCGIWEIEMMESVPVVEMTLISKAFDANLAPSHARLTILEEDIDSIILNIDLLAYVSRDNGITWSQAILEKENNFDLDKQTLVSYINISSQPSDIKMRYKIFTTNSKQLKIHSTSLMWD